MSIFAGMLLMLTYFFNMWACEKRWVQQWEDSSVDLATSVESRNCGQKYPAHILLVFQPCISNPILILPSLVSFLFPSLLLLLPALFVFLCWGVFPVLFSLGNKQWGTPPGLAAVFELDLEHGCWNKTHCCRYGFSTQHTFPGIEKAHQWR